MPTLTSGHTILTTATKSNGRAAQDSKLHRRRHLSRASLLHNFSVERVNGEVRLIGAAQFLDSKNAADGDRTDGKAGCFSWYHADNDAIVEGRTWAEATFHVVPHQHKLRQAALLKAGQNVAPDANPLRFKRGHAFGQQIPGERISLLHLKLDVVKRNVLRLARRTRLLGGGYRRRRQIGWSDRRLNWQTRLQGRLAGDRC